MGRKFVSKQKYPTPIREEKFYLKTQFEPKSFGQEFYYQALQESDITICAGPAGTGKSWIATRYALSQLLSNRVEKIIVTKPIIEAGEQELGFLPGSLEEKVLPYFQSLLDCFEDHIGPTMLKNLIDREKIKFIPLAYMRGADYKHAVILADECQNLTKKGVRLMMTRISEGSQILMNGDTDQIDLPKEKDSGLAWAVERLRGRNARISVCEMTQADIQRHELISVILSALR